MGVEGGTISAGGGGPSIGGGVGVNAGPAVGAPGGEFGPGAGIGSTIVNEGPVAPAFLEKTEPLSIARFNPVGEIIFNPDPSVIEQAEGIAAAAWEASQPAAGVEQAEQVAVRAWESTLALQGVSLEAQRTKTALEAAGMVDLSRKVASFIQPELRSVAQPTLAVSVPLAEEKQVEQLVEEEEVQVEEGVDEAQDSDEEIEELRLKHVEDVEVSEQRRQEIRSAIQKAKLEAEKEGVSQIEGWRVIKFLPPEHEGTRSQIVKKRGPDGSLSETYEELAARSFSSEAQALEETFEIVSEKPPVKRGKDGNPVKNEDILRVFKHHLVKRLPHDEVVFRIIKKRKVELVKSEEQPAQVDVKSDVTEGRIEDYPDLAEVFQKAA